MKLTDAAIRKAKPEDKTYKMADGGGMYLEVTPTGSKYWRLKYRFNGKEKRLALGVYPDVPLALARERREAARKLLANDVDPGLLKKQTKHANKENAANSFEAVAREWFAKHSPNWVPRHGERILRRLEKDLFPWLGNQPISDITPPMLLSVLRRIESRGALNAAHRTHQNCGQIFRYAVATGRAERDPSGDLRGALPPARETHHASITEPKAIGTLLRVIQGYEGSFITKCALQLAPLLFVRPGELRQAEWEEIDFETAEWRIPGKKMKMGALHIVPLSTQALNVFRDLHPLTGQGRYVFPGARSADRPMSDNTVNAALRRMGYGNKEMTGHGFRSMASTLLNEQGWNRDAIERQLAHAERDEVRAAYNYAEHLPERRRMMQHWADYLDKVKAGAEVILLRA